MAMATLATPERRGVTHVFLLEKNYSLFHIIRLSFPHHLAVDSMTHFFLSGIPSRSNPLSLFNAGIARSAVPVLANKNRLFEQYYASRGAPFPA